MLKRLTTLLKKKLSARTPPEESAWIKAGALSAAGSERKYWQKTGLEKGTEIYARYLHLFHLTPADLSDKIVADLGCGSFGGILAVLPQCKAAFPIDVLAEDYNTWGVCSSPIYKFDGNKTEIPAGVCDVVFCTNALDHTTKPELMIMPLHETQLLRTGACQRQRSRSLKGISRSQKRRLKR